MEAKIGKALVIGAGIGGIRAALDLAETGVQVTLIERAPHIGGLLAQLDQQFPSNHCGMCRMLPLLNRDAGTQFCLRKGLFHDNIEILTGTELTALEGEAGHFSARLRSRPTWVDPSLCVGCGLCATVCPVTIPDSFNEGLGRCQAIHLPVPHAIPNPYVIDRAACTRCGACVTVCPTAAITIGADRRADFAILVVDDEPAVRDSLREWLLAEGFPTVAMAASGAEALELLSNTPFQLMLSDIKMPGMDGVSLLAKAREIVPDLDVLMMTAYATVETAVAAMKLGARDYIMKPFDLAAVLPMITRLYAERETAADRELQVNAVIVATGTGFFHPTEGPNTYEYGRHPHVITNLELERLLSRGGPTQGALTRPADGKPIGKIAWLQCVGSRDIQAGADFCSSICCMISIKEALLVKERSAGTVESTIFHMDLRTAGKSYQRYKETAAAAGGVCFQRARIHSIASQPQSGDPLLRIVDVEGALREEAFDLVVLAVGQRPARDTHRFAQIVQTELNPWGFIAAAPLTPAGSLRDGVYLAGTAGGQKDISEAVLAASAAAAEAGRKIHAAGGSLAVAAAPAAAAATDEPPRVLAVLCACGARLNDAQQAQISGVLQADPAVTRVAVVDQLCTQTGWQDLTEQFAGAKANRLLIGACHPYLFIRKLKALARRSALPPQFFEAVDLELLQNTPAVPALYALQGALARLKYADPQPIAGRAVTQRALVVGGGPAGLQAALTIADHGFAVELIEKETRLGGNLNWLQRTLGEHTTAALGETLVRSVEKHPNIQVHTATTVSSAHGAAGDFRTVIQDQTGAARVIAHGVTILATGGTEAATQEYAYGTHDAIITQKAFEERMNAPDFDAGRLACVVMIQCVGSREEPRNYCSRVCCPTTLKQALRLKAAQPDTQVFVFYRDMMTRGFDEQYFTQARKAGVVFFGYDPAAKPRVEVVDKRVQVTGRDPLLGREVSISTDLLVLATGVVPHLPAELAAAYGAEMDQDGFFQEADAKWRPVDSLREGVFACGLALAPHSLGEALTGGAAAAQRALRILVHKELPAVQHTAFVRESLCAVCGNCVSVCAYNARGIDSLEHRLWIDTSACQGCGACAAACPNGAAVVGGQFMPQMLASIDAACG